MELTTIHGRRGGRPDLIVLLTGSRTWDDLDLAEQVFESLSGPRTIFHIGDCPSGLDAYAWASLTARPHLVIRHNADWDRYGKAAGPERNQRMVNGAVQSLGTWPESTGLCLGFPTWESVGTWDCMRRAESAGISHFDASTATLDLDWRSLATTPSSQVQGCSSMNSAARAMASTMIDSKLASSSGGLKNTHTAAETGPP